MADTSVIYPCHNRLFYTQITLPRIIDECRRSKRFQHLYLYDDMSVDGTSEFIDSLEIHRVLGLKRYTLIRQKIGNSTFQINHAFQAGDAKYLCKIDNDTLIPEGCLDIVAALLDANPKYGFMGIGYHGESPGRASFPRIEDKLEVVPASHIGGIGVFRHKVFERFGEIATKGKFFGFTNYQKRAIRSGILAGWAKGVWVLDLDESTTYSRVEQYRDQGWARNIVGKVDSVFQPKTN